MDRLTYHARRAGVRRFSALVQSDNPNALALVKGAGDTRQHSHTGVVELVIELPPKRGIGAQLGRALRAAAAGSLVPGKALAERVAVGVESSPPPPVGPLRPIRTIVVGTDGSETAGKALAGALGLAAALGAALHVVSAYGALRTPAEAERCWRQRREPAAPGGWRPSRTRGEMTPPRR